MLAADRGLVLRVFPLRETSAIVSVLGRSHGRLRLVGRGVRAPKSRAGASLESGNEVDFVFTLRPGRDLGNLREVTLVRPWIGALGRLEPMAVAWAALEILERVLPEGAPEEGILDEVLAFLAALQGSSDRAAAVLRFYGFELALLDRLGHAPELGACRLCAGPPSTGGELDAAEGIWVCSRCQPHSSRRLPLPPAAHELLLRLEADPEVAGLTSTTVEARRQVGRILHHLLALHLERYRYPRALGLLKKVDASVDTSPPEAEVE